MFEEVEQKEAEAHPQECSSRPEPFMLLWTQDQRRVFVYDSKFDAWSPFELGFALLEDLFWLVETPDHRLWQNSPRAFRIDAGKPEPGHFSAPFCHPLTQQIVVQELIGRRCLRGSAFDLPAFGGIPSHRLVFRVLNDETRLYLFTARKFRDDSQEKIVVLDADGSKPVTLDESVRTEPSIATQQRLYFVGADNAIWSVSLLVNKDQPVLVGKLRRPIRCQKPKLLLASHHRLIVLEPDFAQICCLSGDPLLWEPMTPPPRALHVNACTTASPELVAHLGSFEKRDPD